jgi:hypothetical protein
MFLNIWKQVAGELIFLNFFLIYRQNKLGLKFVSNYFQDLFALYPFLDSKPFCILFNKERFTTIQLHGKYMEQCCLLLKREMLKILQEVPQKWAFLTLRRNLAILHGTWKAIMIV